MTVARTTPGRRAPRPPARGGCGARRRAARRGRARAGRRAATVSETSLAPTSAPRGREPVGGVQRPQHDHVDEGGDGGHDHEGARHPHPPHERVGAERHPPVQHVGDDRGHGDRGEVGQRRGSSRSPAAAATSSPMSTTVGTSATRARRRSRSVTGRGAPGRRSAAALAVGGIVAVGGPRRDRSAGVGRRAAGHGRPQGEEDGERDPERGEGVGDPLDRLAPVGQLDVLVGGDHHHEVRRDPVGPVGTLDPPVGEVRRLHEHRRARRVDVEGDAVGADLDAR